MLFTCTIVNHSCGFCVNGVCVRSNNIVLPSAINSSIVTALKFCIGPSKIAYFTTASILGGSANRITILFSAAYVLLLFVRTCSTFLPSIVTKLLKLGVCVMFVKKSAVLPSDINSSKSNMFVPL